MLRSTGNLTLLDNIQMQSGIQPRMPFYKRRHGKLKLHAWLSEFINGDDVANIEP